MAAPQFWRRAAEGRVSRRRALATAGVSVGVMSIAAACGRDNDTTTTGTGGTTGQLGSTPVPTDAQPRRGGTLRGAGGPFGAQLDIHRTNTPWESSGVWHWAGNFLVRFNKEGLPEPDLAQTMPEVTDGGTTLIFRLNPNAKWQPRAPVNGRAVEAEDIKFTVERIRNPQTNSPRASFFANVTNMETPDNRTIVIRTRVPEPDLLAKFSDQYQIIVPREWSAKDPTQSAVASAQDVVGTGPYMLESWTLDQGFRMTRRPDGYWKENKAWFDAWEVRRVDDSQSQIAAMRAGQIDSVGVPGDEVRSFEQDRGNYYTLRRRNPTRECLMLNQQRDLYRDVRVRQAIWRAVERRQIYENVFAGLGIAGGPMSPAAATWVLPDNELEQLPGFKRDRNAELQEARQLLAAAGHPNGFEDTMTTVTAFLTNEQADLYVPQLQRIGIRYRLENVGTDFNTILQRQIRGEYSAAATLFLSGPYPDAQINQYHYTNASRNYARFSDARLDSLMDQQSQEFDTDRRRQIVFDIQRELINNPSGFIWVGSRTEVAAYRNYYKGVWYPNYLAGYPAAEDGFFDR
jgi:peptide/nickel transport system substrate-binding protein